MAKRKVLNQAISNQAVIENIKKGVKHLLSKARKYIRAGGDKEAARG